MTLSFGHPLALALLFLLVPLARAWRSRPNSLTPQRLKISLFLRCLTLSCLILAAAGAQMVTLTEKLSVVFLMDRSLSTGGESQGWQREYVAKALGKRKDDDGYGLVLYGKDARVELPAGAHDRLDVDAFSVVVDRGASNLTSALRYAATAFPGDSASRLVLLSDGQSTEGEASDEVAALKAAGIEVWTVPLPDDRVRDLLLSRLEAPNEIAIDEPFILRTVIESVGIKDAELLLSANGKIQERLKVTLRDGPNLFLLPQRIREPGPVRYEARVLSREDQHPENNKGEALLVVGKEQSVLVLRSGPGPGVLVPMLRKAGLRAEAVTPAELPRRVGAWRDVSALVIEDVSALDWPVEIQKMVSLLVRDGGMGLVMLGSSSTFGVGGYQGSSIEPLLPVSLAVRRPKDMPLAALVQLLDKSGSMSGRPIEMAREAAIAAGGTLSERDLLGVVGFDEAARWVYDFGPKGDGKKFRNSVAGLRAGGGTDLYPAFKEGLDALVRSEAPVKHIIVLSDGMVAPGDYDGLLDDAVKNQVTVSAVALGGGADLTFLEHVTKKGKGRLYVTPEASAGSPLPQIFIRDTLLATGSGINNKPAEVRAVKGGTGGLLEGLDIGHAPRLLAHNMASSKGGTASTLLATAKKDPILAVGRAGLGKTAAWTSDLGGKWAASWLAYRGAGGSSLLETVLLRTVRSVNAVGNLEERSRGGRLEAKAINVGDLSTIALKLTSREPIEGPVKVVVVDSRGDSTEAVLQPEGPYLASGSIQVTEPGSSLLFAQDAKGRPLARSNLSLPLAPEFARLGTDREELKTLAQRSGGRFDVAPEEVFNAPEEPFPLGTPLDDDLVRGALLLLLLEIAVRRLPVPKRLSRKPSPALSAQATTAATLRHGLSQRRTARDGLAKPAIRRATRDAPGASGASGASAAERTSPSTPLGKPDEPAGKPLEPSQGGTMARLREAKKRGQERAKED